MNKIQNKLFKFLSVLAYQKEIKLNLIDKLKLFIFAVFMLFATSLTILVYMDKFLQK